nr:signal peptidase II [Allorhizobium borbori]
MSLAMAVLLAALVVDQATKWIIINWVMVPPRVIPITGFFNLVLGWNTGVSFGMFSTSSVWALVFLSAVIMVALFMWLTRAQSTLQAAAIGLILGGATGNVIDRLIIGGVTDFLDFYVGDWHWPSFNTADIFIVCGAALLLLVDFRSSAKPVRHQRP